MNEMDPAPVRVKKGDAGNLSSLKDGVFILGLKAEGIKIGADGDGGVLRSNFCML